jgi:hypothetical protein
LIINHFSNIASSHSSVGRASHCNQTGCHRPKQLLRMSPVRSGLRGFIFCRFLRCVAPSIRAQGNISDFCQHAIRVEGMNSSSPPFLTLDSISFASIWEACACLNRLEKPSLHSILPSSCKTTSGRKFCRPQALARVFQISHRLASAICDNGQQLRVISRLINREDIKNVASKGRHASTTSCFPSVSERVARLCP